ncbi:hypothetical protein Pla108_14500 [Botrimarina colliarenosi]|uniref:Uncharacterized protein n=1 Tax=Botrimarina colliarenosi TaxID=2528001 RepID=A0A5C6AMK6_9BACT|nr:glycosaminoglycan attachment protein [Botrimarina colliarenosi]TWU00499.1 hypothetical protein Pla108_14500 [Botrimarina colliarenosi]
MKSKVPQFDNEGHRLPSLFTPIVEESRLHPSFRMLMEQPGFEPQRWMMDDVFSSYEDRDGNFVEQFQSTGFDQRTYELYLYAYLSRSGFSVDRRYAAPDFSASNEELDVAIEATTVNKATSGVVGREGRTIRDLNPAELAAYVHDELPIRFGSALFSKLKKKYWELPHCRDRAIVIAIEPFHDDDALGLTDSGLSAYLFGATEVPSRTEDKRLKISSKSTEEHQLAEKRIPSYFFGQPDTKHISGVLFSNSGTAAKFKRMGYQHGVGNERLVIQRTGFAYAPEDTAQDPAFFSYNLDNPPMVETWGQGLVLYHNPNCLHPIPLGAMPDVVDCWIEDGKSVSRFQGWHPYASKTVTLHFGEVKEEIWEQLQLLPRSFSINPIPHEVFHGIARCVIPMPEVYDEQGWFMDDTGAFLGVLVFDRCDHDWAFAVHVRNQNQRFTLQDFKTGIETRDQARGLMHEAMTKLLQSPQRLFHSNQE